MTFLDLSDARRDGVSLRTGKRSMNPQNSSALIGGANGGFASAKIDRLTRDWSTVRRSADQDLFNGLTKMRARARERAINSPIISKFLQMLRTNIVGAHGIKLNFKIEKLRSAPDATEIYDDKINLALHKAWRKWCTRKFCTVQGNLSFKDLCNLWADAMGRDGDYLLRRVYVPKSQNPFGFSLQLIDADQLNEAINRVGSPSSPTIRMGVELDPYQKPIAYHLFDGNPNEVGFGTANCKRVPAEQVYHSYVIRRPGQSRGYPLAAPALYDVNQLDKYFDAALVGARTAASLLASIEQKEGAPEYDGDGENQDGSAKIEMESGTIAILGANQTLNNQTPNQPTGTFAPFVERSLRLIASGLNVAYHELGNDLAGVNFSSGRLGVQEERDYFMELQRVLIEQVIQPVYEDWVRAALLNNAIEGVPFDVDRYTDEDAVKFMPRRWDWVDPLKDTQANIDSVQNAFKTHEEILSAQGKDWREVYRQLAAEQQYADELGIEVGTDIRGEATSEINDGEPDAPASPDAPAAPEKPASTKPAKTKPPSTKPPKKAKKELAEDGRQQRRLGLLNEPS
jgi:lambda family phage portal protein